MDPEKRIEELEAEVHELTGLVHRLLADKQAASPPPSESPAPAEPPAKPSPAREVYKADLSRNVQKVLGGEAGEPLESRIGSIWLSRVAVLIVLTTLVLGARVTVRAEVLPPLYKVLIGYGVALAGMAYGAVFRREKDLFSQAILGGGLAALYFTTYAAFFLEGVIVFSDRSLAFPLLLACLVFMMGTAHWRRSQTVAGLSLFLTYFTVVLSCMHGKNAENIIYALGTCALLAIAVMVFHAAHRWLLLTWAAMAATYVTYFYFFLRKPAGLDLSDRDYFWVSGGFLALCYVVFSCASILDARKTGEYRRTVAPMAGVNSFIFFGLTWVGIREHYLADEWLFRLCFAAALLLFSVFAETTGPKRNYLFQVFIAKTVIMFTLALQAYLSREKLVVAMAVESLALAFSYKRSGVVTFKALGMGLLFVTFVSCLLTVKDTRPLALGPYTIPANWFSGVGAPLAYVVVAWFYEHFVRRVKPDRRVVSGQWFLADTVLDVHSATAAMFHAAAAALILLTVTIMDQGGHPALPYVLGGEGVAMAVAGFLLRTPQIEAASVMLLIAAHVCYHAFLQFGLNGFETQESYAVYTVLLALFTFVGAHLWERYLKRVQGGRPWEHDVVAAVPYLAATFMLTTFMGRRLDTLHAAVCQDVLGVVLLVVATVTRFTGMKASGIMALGIGGATFYTGLYTFDAPIQRLPGFLPFFVLALATYAAGERALAVSPHGAKHVATRTDNTLRTLLVVGAVFLGLIGLNEGCNEGSLTRYWLALAVAMITAGALFRESRYRWAALVVFAIVIGRAFVFDLWQLAPVYQFLSFAALTVPLLVISWAYSRQRARTLDGHHGNVEDPAPPGPEGVGGHTDM